MKSQQFIDNDSVDALIMKTFQIKPRFFKQKGQITEEEEKEIIARAPKGKSGLSIRKSKGAKCRCNHGRVAHNESCQYKNCDCMYFSIKPHTL